jgi:transposase InsO family protein
VHAWLRRQGYRVARKRVARIMREHGWAGVMGRIRVRTTRRDRSAAPAPDLVARGFNPDAPDRIWAGDVERHEALWNRAVMKGHRLRALAGVW